MLPKFIAIFIILPEFILPEKSLNILRILSYIKQGLYTLKWCGLESFFVVVEKCILDL